MATRDSMDAVQELQEKAAYYRKLADAEPLGDMRDMLQRVADGLEEVATKQAKKKPRR